MSKRNISYIRIGLKPDAAPDNFKLDEIQWDNQYPVHPELIPFENTTKKIIEELKQLSAQADNLKIS